jgi:hypothetical protein
MYSKLRVERAEAGEDAFLGPNTPGSSLGDAVYVLIEHAPDDFFLVDFASFILLHNTLDAFNSTKEDQGMLEALILPEIYHLCIVGGLVIADSELEIIAILGSRDSLIGALIKDVLELLSHSNCVAPVETKPISRLRRANDCSRVIYTIIREQRNLTFLVLVKVSFIELDCDASVFLEHHVDLTILK